MPPHLARRSGGTGQNESTSDGVAVFQGSDGRVVFPIATDDEMVTGTATDRLATPAGVLASINNKLSIVGAGTYTHTQNAPATVWNIAHNLGNHPSVSVVDSAGTVVEGQVEYIDANNVRLTFSAAFGGKAYLN